MSLTRDAILGAQDIKTEEVPVPEWGGSVFVRGLTAAQRDSFEASMFVGEGDDRKFSAENIRAKLLVRCLVNEAGERLFADNEDEVLGAHSGAVLDRLFTVAQRLSGIARDDLKNAVKN